jgi:hypothetical protein
MKAHQSWSSHQVSNEAHCIKIATDFVSPESLSSCLNLSNEFRDHNLADAWKDDVLQLTSLLYYAWLSLQRPLEETRATFANPYHPGAQDNPDSAPTTTITPVAPATEGEPRCEPGRKRKFQVEHGDDDHRRAKRAYRCPTCPPGTKTFLSHGMIGHMYVATFVTA